jgi:hypothetical protein
MKIQKNSWGTGGELEYVWLEDLDEDTGTMKNV